MHKSGGPGIPILVVKRPDKLPTTMSHSLVCLILKFKVSNNVKIIINMDTPNFKNVISRLRNM